MRISSRAGAGKKKGNNMSNIYRSVVSRLVALTTAKDTTVTDPVERYGGAKVELDSDRLS